MVFMVKTRLDEHLLYVQIKDTTGQCWLQCPLPSYVHHKTAKVVQSEQFKWRPTERHHGEI